LKIESGPSSPAKLVMQYSETPALIDEAAMFLLELHGRQFSGACSFRIGVSRGRLRLLKIAMTSEETC
jgi:hypothetical protein